MCELKKNYPREEKDTSAPYATERKTQQNMYQSVKQQKQYIEQKTIPLISEQKQFTNKK